MNIPRRRMLAWLVPAAIFMAAGAVPEPQLLVVGTVTDTTARVLIEMRTRSTPGVQGTVVELGSSRTGGLPCDQFNLLSLMCLQEIGNASSCVSPFQTTIGISELTSRPTFTQDGVPTVFKFEGLRPGTHYDIVFKDGECSGGNAVTHYVRIAHRAEVAGVPSEYGHQRFWTLPDLTTVPGRNPMNIAAASCNKPRLYKQNEATYPELGNMWKRMAEEKMAGDKFADQRVHMIVHMGDQIYMDDEYHIWDEGEDKAAGSARLDYCAFCKAEVLMRSVDMSDAAAVQAAADTVFAIFRQVYYLAWRENAQLRFLLANTPNLMIADDHSIRDDWADGADDFNPNSKQYFLGKIAYRLALYYQAQLNDDIPHTDQGYTLDAVNHAHVKDDFFGAHVFGGVGVMMLDSRFARTFSRLEYQSTDTYPLLGGHQWMEVSRALHPTDGSFKDVKALFVVSTVPMAVMQRGVTRIAVKGSDDVKGFWSHEDNIDELVRMFAMLEDWKCHQSGQGACSNDGYGLGRQVMLLGGDLHIAGFTHIYADNDRQIFSQVISSGITNDPPTGSDWKIFKKSLEISKTVGGWRDSLLNRGYEFRHDELFNDYNYVIASTTYPNDKPRAWVRSKLCLAGQRQCAVLDSEEEEGHHHNDRDLLVLWILVGVVSFVCCVVAIIMLVVRKCSGRSVAAPQETADPRSTAQPGHSSPHWTDQDVVV
eukprot:TRINITY_DN5001_c0_g1_i1.p1 TRINITY_DN5001_c0_g1~~TRINITY_DN5001_c0_g1_i1.p1  ORF type:complete len:706 (+),score=158.65 TRINITY_DN5001_c0_g1_i1:76-2193(+)